MTSAQMRAIEAAAIAAGTATGAGLMERAGAGAVAALLAHWPDFGRAPARAVVLCGPGNNGGDGYVIARHLRARGWAVSVHAADWAEAMAGRVRPGDAGAMARRWVASGGRVGPVTADALAAALTGDGAPVVLVDALLGIGQNRPADAMLAPVQAALDAAGAADIRVLAVDVPTGFDADSGAPLAQAPVAADLCVTFHAEKPVHAALRAAGVAVAVVDIGLSGGDI